MSKLDVGQALTVVQLLAEVGKLALERQAGRPVDGMTVEEMRAHARVLQDRIRPWPGADEPGG